MKFIHWNFVDKPLPGSYDLIFSRDALQHNEAKDVQIALEYFVKSGSKYLLTSTHVNGINARGKLSYANNYYPIDLLSEPLFNLPQPFDISL